MSHEQAGRPGRKRDGAKDLQILDASLAVLAEQGYEGTTMEAIASRAGAAKATVYRRWPSKAHVVHDAIRRMAEQDVGDVPDTGGLLGDLRALQRPAALGAQRLKIIVALTTMSDVDRADVGDAAIRSAIGPWVEVNRILLRRAVDRGEIDSTSDVELLSRLIPSMCLYRVAVERQPLDLAFTSGLIERVLLPAVGLVPD